VWGVSIEDCNFRDSGAHEGADLEELDPKHTLADQCRHLVLDQLRRAIVQKAAGKPLDQADRAIGRAQHKRTPIRRYLATGKGGYHRAPSNACKTKQIRATLCLHRVSSWL